MKLHHALLIVCAAAGLSACGGGESISSPAENPNAVPSSATTSTTAYRQFAASLRDSETAQPLDVNTVGMAPTSETETATAL